MKPNPSSASVSGANEESTLPSYIRSARRWGFHFRHSVEDTKRRPKRVDGRCHLPEDRTPPPAGCSGMAYTMEFTESSNADDTVVEHDGVTVIIDAQAAAYLVGTEMDYAEGTLNAGFVFNNPNEKGRCGCGESFHV